MTGREHGFDVCDCGDEVAAYALGALDAADAAAFRTHLETCAVCRDELAAFEAVVEIMPISAPQHPVPRLVRRRVLRTVRRESRVRRREQRRRRGQRSFAMPSMSRPALMPRPALALGAALVIAAAAFGGVELGTSGSTKTRVYAAQVTGSGSADVSVSAGHAELVVRGFAPPPPGHIYEVWLERSGQAPAPTSALFSVTAQGDGDVDVPGDLHGVTKVLVTPEPAGGSRVPTHSPVISVQLS